MVVRRLSVVVGVALIVAGCGGSTTRAARTAVHVDGERAQGDYVLETDASGAQFLVPAPLLAGQGRRTFDVSAPARATVGERSGTSVVSTPPYRMIVDSATAVVPYSAHVEILASGAPGRRFELSWEETCGWAQEGQAAFGGTGGQGFEVLRSPAVTLVKLPRIDGGARSCYLAATASTTTFTRRLRLTIIDY